MPEIIQAQREADQARRELRRLARARKQDAENARAQAQMWAAIGALSMLLLIIAAESILQTIIF